MRSPYIVTEGEWLWLVTRYSSDGVTLQFQLERANGPDDEVIADAPEAARPRGDDDVVADADAAINAAHGGLGVASN